MSDKGMAPPPDQADHIGKAGVSTRDLSLPLAHLNFLGKGLVRLAHDLKNHLATLNESAGLMADLLNLQEKQRRSWRGRLLRGGQTPSVDLASVLGVLEEIEKGAAQAATLIQNLGRFGHRLEEPRAVFESDRVLEEIRDLLLRQAGERGIHLEIKPSERVPLIETHPSGFQMAVMWILDEVMACTEQGQKVVLETEVRQDTVLISFEGPCWDNPLRVAAAGCDEGDFYRDRVEALGGQVWQRSGHGKVAVTLAFPLVE